MSLAHSLPQNQRCKPEDLVVWSPIAAFPRNAQCICGSGNKWKHCHNKKQDPYATLKRKDADKFKAQYPEHYKTGRSA